MYLDRYDPRQTGKSWLPRCPGPVEVRRSLVTSGPPTGRQAGSKVNASASVECSSVAWEGGAGGEGRGGGKGVCVDGCVVMDRLPRASLTPLTIITVEVWQVVAYVRHASVVRMTQVLYI